MKRTLVILALLVLHASLTRELHAADTIIKPGSPSNPANAGKMYLQTADNKLVPATVVYTTDGNGNLVPINSTIQNINVGTVGQGASGNSSDPWYVRDVTAQGILNSILAKHDVNASTRASETTLAALNAKVNTCDTSNVTITSMPLVGGQATAAKQDTGNTSLASIDGKTPTVGQKTSANSRPVVIASDQSAIPTTSSNLDVALSTRATESTLSALNGKLSTTVNGLKVDVIASVLPTGSATSSKQDTLDTDLLSFKSANHTDSLAIQSAIQSSEPRAMQDGSGNALTSQVNGTQRALDVGINVGGAQVDPRQGHVASGVADAGNPLKVAGKVNTSFQSFSDGQRADLQQDRFGNMRVANSSTYRNIVGAATVAVKASAGRLVSYCTNKAVPGDTLTVYDSTSASGTKIMTTTLPGGNPSPFCAHIGGAEFVNGLTVVSTGTSDWTVFYQ